MKLHWAYAFDAHTKVCLKHGLRLLLGDTSHCFFPHTATCCALAMLCRQRCMIPVLTTAKLCRVS